MFCQRNTEYVVNVINNEVSVLPTVEESSRRSPSSHARTESGRPLLHKSVYHDSPGEAVSLIFILACRCALKLF